MTYTTFANSPRKFHALDLVQWAWVQSSECLMNEKIVEHVALKKEINLFVTARHYERSEEIPGKSFQHSIDIYAFNTKRYLLNEI